MVGDGARRGLLDEIVGTGFCLLATAATGRTLEADGTAATLPLLTSSVGRVYLAHLPATLTDPIVQSQQPAMLTGKEIRQIKEDVLRDGVAVTSGGVIPGVTSVAAPVFTTGESLPLAVALALPAQHATPDVLREVSADLLDATKAMSAEIGHQVDAPARTRSAARPQRRADSA